MCRAFEEYGNEIRRETSQKYEAAIAFLKSEKDAALSEKDIALSEKDAALSEKDKEIAFLKAELEKRKREQLLH